MIDLLILIGLSSPLWPLAYWLACDQDWQQTLGIIDTGYPLSGLLLDELDEVDTELEEPIIVRIAE